MDYNSSNWTGRTPRTLNEAFGPDTSNVIDDAREWGAAVGVCISLILGVLAVATLLFLSVIVSPARAAPISPDPTEMVKAWNAANDHCAGDQIDPDANPACAQRDQLGQVLFSVGYIQSYNDVWIGPLTLNVFCQSMYTAEALTSDTERMQYLAHDLNAQIPLRLQFGLWNAPAVRSLIQRRLPRAFASWSRLMKAQASLHARDNDPSLTLVGDD